MEPTKRLIRSRTNRVLGGVCGGIGEYFQIDPIIVRVLFVAAAIWGGFGVGLYILLWILLPGEGRENEPRLAEFKDEIHESAERVAAEFRGSGDHAGDRFNDRRMLVALILILFGALLLIRQFTPIPFFQWNFFWPLILIIVGLLIIKR